MNWPLRTIMLVLFSEWNRVLIIMYNLKHIQHKPCEHDPSHQQSMETWNYHLKNAKERRAKRGPDTIDGSSAPTMWYNSGLGAIHERLPHLPRREARHLDVRLAAVERVEAGVLANGQRRVDPGEDARLAPGSEALHNRPVDLRRGKLASNANT